jgi:hypothetical protein
VKVSRHELTSFCFVHGLILYLNSPAPSASRLSE